MRGDWDKRYCILGSLRQRNSGCGKKERIRSRDEMVTLPAIACVCEFNISSISFMLRWTPHASIHKQVTFIVSNRYDMKLSLPAPQANLGLRVAIPHSPGHVRTKQYEYRQNDLLAHDDLALSSKSFSKESGTATGLHPARCCVNATYSPPGLSLDALCMLAKAA